MLFVWMFALLSGLANACALEDHRTQIAYVTNAHAELDGGKHISLASDWQAEAAPAQKDESHSSREPCLKVCDDSSRSLPKQYPSGEIDPGHPVVVALLWTSGAPINIHRDQAIDVQLGVSRLPLRIRYSRLVL